MSEETFYPAAGTDDGISSSDSNFNNNWEYCAFGLWFGAGPTVRNAFFRFPDVTIDQGSTITSCLLKVYGVTVNPFPPRAGSTYLNVYLVDEDNPDAPISDAEYNNLSVTDAIEWEEANDWTTDTLYESPELKTILQNIVDRGGFSSGNAVIVLVKDNSSGLNAYQKTRSYDYDSGSKKAELYVEWESASSSEEVTAEPLIGIGSLSALVTGNNVRVTVPSFIAQSSLEASVLYQAINTRVPWIDDNKGSGPWSFLPSKNKLSYNEGDRISSSVDPTWEAQHNFSGVPITDKHNPCGYWSREILLPDKAVINGVIDPKVGEDIIYYRAYSHEVIGNKLYIGCYPYCTLFEWDSAVGGTPDLVASTFDVANDKFSWPAYLDILNNKLYGVCRTSVSYDNDKLGGLLFWNGVIASSWTNVAPGGAHYATDVAFYAGNYYKMGSDEKAYWWNETQSIWVEAYTSAASGTSAYITPYEIEGVVYLLDYWSPSGNYIIFYRWLLGEASIDHIDTFLEIDRASFEVRLTNVFIGRARDADTSLYHLYTIDFLEDHPWAIVELDFVEGVTPTALTDDGSRYLAVGTKDGEYALYVSSDSSGASWTEYSKVHMKTSDYELVSIPIINKEPYGIFNNLAHTKITIIKW